jgi:murein DD-endopeptidase MepM/ murein hydrolase activator NlpD
MKRAAKQRLVLASSMGAVAVAMLVAVLTAGPRDWRPEPTAEPITDPAVASDAHSEARPAADDDKDDDNDDVDTLRKRRLTLPVQGTTRDVLRRSFGERRGGDRQHEAMDILAVRDTPVLAVEGGRIAKLFLSKAGGLTIYQFDPGETNAYYYAHLARYADGVKEQARVEGGQVIGYVGTSGNAPPDAPHLHFAIFKLTEQKHWWQGTPIDPYPVLK